MSVQVGSKYGNRSTRLDGHFFASLVEAERYKMLKLLEAAGDIRDLRCQRRVILQEAFVDAEGRKWPAISYYADFAYREPGNPREVLEDVKGFRTDVFRIKERLLRKTHPELDFRVIGA